MQNNNSTKKNDNKNNNNKNNNKSQPQQQTTTTITEKQAKVKKTLLNPFQHQFPILSETQQSQFLSLIEQYNFTNEMFHFEPNEISQFLSKSIPSLSSSSSLLSTVPHHHSTNNNNNNNVNNVNNNVNDNVNNNVDNNVNNCNVNSSDSVLLIFPDANYKELQPIEIDYLKMKCSMKRIPFVNLNISLNDFTKFFTNYFTNYFIKQNSFFEKDIGKSNEKITINNNLNNTNLNNNLNHLNDKKVMKVIAIYNATNLIKKLKEIINNLYFIPSYLLNQFKFVPTVIEDVTSIMNISSSKKKNKLNETTITTTIESDNNNKKVKGSPNDNNTPTKKKKIN
ncbi:hypothetical protein ABK040_010566 [Willaertia magna]